MDPKKTPLLRLAGVNSDASRVVQATRTVALLNPDSGRYLEGVTATVRLLSPAEVNAIEEKNTDTVKGPRGIEKKVNLPAFITEVLLETVEAWQGIIGADNKPMPLCAAALQHGVLDELNRAHLAGVAKTPAEVVDAEVVAESFREPAGVAGVAG